MAKQWNKISDLPTNRKGYYQSQFHTSDIPLLEESMEYSFDMGRKPKYFSEDIGSIYPDRDFLPPDNPHLKPFLNKYLYAKTKGILISERKTEEIGLHTDYEIIADSISDFLRGNYLMNIFKIIGSYEGTSLVIVREGKRICGFVNSDCGINFSEKDNQILEDYKEFCEPDELIENLTEKEYLTRLQETWENIQTGSPRFFKK